MLTLALTLSLPQQDVTRPQLPWVGVRRDALRRWGGHRHREHARCQARGSKRFVSSAWFQALRFTRFCIPAAYRLHKPETARRPTPSHNAELSIAVHRLVSHRSAPPTGVAKYCVWSSGLISASSTSGVESLLLLLSPQSCVRPRRWLSMTLWPQ